jgi:hypothetical protein
MAGREVGRWQTDANGTEEHLVAILAEALDAQQVALGPANTCRGGDRDGQTDILVENVC